MAILTWRDVASQQGNPVQAAGLAAQLFDAAGSGLQSTLNNFDKAQNAGANQAALLNMLQYTDRAAYQKALAEGTLTSGLDPKRLSTDTLATLAERAKHLQGQEVTDQNMLSTAQKMGITSYEHNRNVAQNATGDAARPVFNGQLATAMGMPALGAYANLPIGQQVELANTVKTAGDATTNKAIQDQAQAIVAKVREAPNIDVAREIIMSNPDVRVRNAAVASPEIAKMYPNNMWGPEAAVSDEGLAGFTAGGGNGIGSLATPGTSAPGLFNSLLQQESRGRQFNTDGSVVTSPKGAIGIAQVMPATGPEAAQLAGLPWDAERFKSDPTYNAKLGEAYFNKQRETFGSDAKALAAYNAGPGALRRAEAKAKEAGKPEDWLSYLPKETQDYVPGVLNRQAKAGGAVPSDVNMTAITAPVQSPGNLEKTLSAVKNGTLDGIVKTIKGQVTTKLTQLDKDGVAKLFLEYGDSTKSHMEVASELTGEKGPLKGNDSSKVAEFIRVKAEEHGVKPELVGRLLETRAERKGFWNWANASTTNLADVSLGDGTMQIKDSKIDDALKNFKKDGTVREAAEVYKRQEQIKSIEEGQKLLTEQKQRAAKLAAQAERMPSFAGQARQAAINLQAMQMDMARLVAALQEASTEGKKPETSW